MGAVEGHDQAEGLPDIFLAVQEGLRLLREECRHVVFFAQLRIDVGTLGSAGRVVVVAHGQACRQIFQTIAAQVVVVLLPAAGPVVEAVLGSVIASAALDFFVAVAVFVRNALVVPRAIEGFASP